MIDQLRRLAQQIQDLTDLAVYDRELADVYAEMIAERQAALARLLRAEEEDRWKVGRVVTTSAPSDNEPKYKRLALQPPAVPPCLTL